MSEHTQHLMTGPVGDSEFVSQESQQCLPPNAKCREEVEGNIEIRAKQN